MLIISASDNENNGWKTNINNKNKGRKEENYQLALSIILKERELYDSSMLRWSAVV